MPTNEITLALQRGWQVFPLVHTSRFAIEQPLLKHATSSVEQIEEWLAQYPECDWAVATGEMSGVFAVVFTRDSGIQTMRSLCAGDFSGMDTLQLRTSKLVTMFFRWPDSGLPTSRREQLTEGITIRHSGGYAPLPSETSSTGKPWFYSNHEAPVKPAPKWLLDRIRKFFTDRRSAAILPFSSNRLKTHIVGVYFRRENGVWICSFRATNDGGALLKTLSLRYTSSIYKLAEKGRITMTSEIRQQIDSSLRRGNGTLLLMLSENQYQRLLAA